MKALPLALSLSLLLLQSSLTHAADAPDAAALAARVAELEQQLRAVQVELARLAPAIAAAPAASPPAGTTAATSATPAPAPLPSLLPNATPGTRLALTGFIRTDALLTKLGDGDLPENSIGRDLYVPGQIPVGAQAEGVELDAHIKWSRLQFALDHDSAAGDKVAARLELDLFGGVLGTKQSTNTYGVTVRHAWVGWNQWLVGQTWTNLFEPATFVDSVDIIGATDGQVFVRQPQVRYTSGPWSFSLENPETTISPRGGGARILSDDNRIPDFIARYTHRTAAGSAFSAALLARELAWETTGPNRMNEHRGALALSLSGKWVLDPANDLRFGLTGGQGIGRYLGIGIASDAAATQDGGIDAVDGLAGFLAWRHVFSPQLRGNLYAAASRFDHDPAAGGAVTARTRSIAGNLFYTPLPKLDLGVELRLAERELESGAEGRLTRLHAIARYSF